MRVLGPKMHSNVLQLAILAITLTIIPFLIKSSYYLLVLNIIGLNVIVVVGLNLLIGYAGQISLGQATFFGMGAYLSALFTTNFDLLMQYPSWIPQWLIPWIIIVLAMLLTGATAYIIGIPTLKLRGNYLVMATLGINIILEIFLIEEDAITGGANGMAGIPHLAFGGFLINSDLKFYCLIWLLVLIILLISFNLVNSRVGRALKAIHGAKWLLIPLVFTSRDIRSRYLHLAPCSHP